MIGNVIDKIGTECTNFVKIKKNVFVHGQMSIFVIYIVLNGGKKYGKKRDKNRFMGK